jgi:plasmid maintenance system antidote protein VapI
MQNLKLKGKIVEKGLSYNRIANLAKVSTVTIQKAVNGGKIRVKTALSIARILDCSVEYLFGEVE